MGFLCLKLIVPTLCVVTPPVTLCVTLFGTRSVPGCIPTQSVGTISGSELFLHRCGLDDFDPVRIRVFDERQALHTAVIQALLEIAAQRFETLARRDDIRH
jgi:hypothetical protein